MTDPEPRFDDLEDWEDFEEDLEAGVFEPIERPPWRRPLLVAIAALTAVALAIVPVYNVLRGRDVAGNGLEICGFDYCVVQEVVRAAGLGDTMSRLANTFYDEEQARGFANALTERLGVEPLGLIVVDDLDGRIGGMYDPADRSVAIERPARAWTVLHEVAHAVAGGHGEEFTAVVVELARWVEEGRVDRGPFQTAWQSLLIAYS